MTANFLMTADGRVSKRNDSKKKGEPAFLHALQEMDAITELYLTIVPWVLGGRKAPSLTGLPGNFLPRPLDFQLKSLKVVGEECLLVYTRKRKKAKKKKLKF